MAPTAQLCSAEGLQVLHSEKARLLLESYLQFIKQNKKNKVIFLKKVVKDKIQFALYNSHYKLQTNLD